MNGVIALADRITELQELMADGQPDRARRLCDELCRESPARGRHGTGARSIAWEWRASKRTGLRVR